MVKIKQIYIQKLFLRHLQLLRNSSDQSYDSSFAVVRIGDHFL